MQDGSFARLSLIVSGWKMGDSQGRVGGGQIGVYCYSLRGGMRP